MPKTIVRLGIRQEVEAALICEKYRKLAPRLVHTNALEHTFPKFYRKKTLTIGVENPAWAEQVIKNKQKIMDEINKALEGNRVINVQTIVASQQRPEGGAR